MSPSIWRCVSRCLLLFAFPTLPNVVSAQSIDGGTTWTGWTSRGLSNQLGVFGSGPTSEVYEVYTTVFTFNNNSVSGGAVGGGPTGGATGFGTGGFSAGSFTNGNRILGIGVRVVSGGAITNFTPTVRFDLDSDSFLPATTVGGGDGRTSFTSWSELRDFTVQFEGAANWRGGTLTMQAGNGTSNGGPNNQQQIVGGAGSGVSYDWPFRAFAQTPNSYQMFFDINALPAIYGGANPFGLNANFTGIGAIGNAVRIALNGMGTNNVVFDVLIPPVAIAAPAGAYQIRYFSHLNLGDSLINITNDGSRGAGLAAGTAATTTGAVCANVYTFSPDEQLVSCCSCPVTPNGLVSLSVRNDLINNTLTPAVPTSVVVKIVGSVPIGGSCSNSATSLVPTTVAGAPGEVIGGLHAWGTTLKAGLLGGSPASVETRFSNATLSTVPAGASIGELARLTQLCTFIVSNASGFGICNSCRLGGLGGSRR